MNDFFIDLVKGCYPYFAVPALAVIVRRIYRKEWTTGESVLLGLFLVHLAAQAAQIRLADQRWSMSRRYLLPAAVLLMPWFGLFVLELWRCLPRFTVFAAVLAMGASLLDMAWPTVAHYRRRSKSETLTAARKIGGLIRADYRDAKLFPAAGQRDPHCYIDRRRPLVKSDFYLTGYFSGGANWIPRSPAAPDYWVAAAPQALPEHYEELGTVAVGRKLYRVGKRRP